MLVHGGMAQDVGPILERAVPFAMEPVVYDFAINDSGACSELLRGDAALMPAAYYGLTVPSLLRIEARFLPPARRAELDRFGAACRTQPELSGIDAESVRPPAPANTP